MANLNKTLTLNYNESGKLLGDLVLAIRRIRLAGKIETRRGVIRRHCAEEVRGLRAAYKMIRDTPFVFTNDRGAEYIHPVTK